MFVVAQYLCKNKIEVEPVPKGWINGDFLMWPKLFNSRFVKNNQEDCNSKYGDDWEAHAAIIKGTFKTFKLAEKEADRLSNVPITDDESNMALLKQIKLKMPKKGGS